MTTTSASKSFWAIPISLLLAANCQLAFADSSVVVESAQPRQIIRGFGASDAWMTTVIHQFPDPARSQVLDLLFSPTNGAGLSMLRHRIPQDIEPSRGVWDWTTDNDMVWVTNQAIARGVQTVWSTPWSPPAWMKSNDSIDNGGSLLPSSYGDYAEYLTTYVAMYKSLFGITINGISLQNEPDINASYESCLWSGQQFHDFIVDDLAPVLREKNLGVKVIMPERSSWDDGYASQTLDDPLSASTVSVVASHDYAGGLYPFTDATSRGKDVWETEVSNLGTNDPSMTDALSWALLIHNSIVTAGVNAWHYWWLVTPYDSGQSLIYLNQGTGTYTAYKRLWTIGNFSRYIRPGFWQVALSSNNPEPGVYTSAYMNIGTKEVVVVAINQNAASTNLKITLPGLPRKSAQAFQTTATQNLASATVTTLSTTQFQATLPAQSVTTFVTQPLVLNTPPGMLTASNR
jgi:glucuronoarabinoxylan endo-1,4-beta-xylanase